MGTVTFAVLGFAIFLFGPPFAVYWVAKTKVDNVNLVMEKAHQLIFEHLKEVGYFTYGAGGGVAIDVQSQIVCLVKARTIKNVTYKLIPYADIKEWQSYKPGKTEWTGISMAAGTSAQLRNQTEVRNQALNTGLTIITKQLDDHQIFICQSNLRKPGFNY